jgi:hypothetical protein
MMTTSINYTQLYKDWWLSDKSLSAAEFMGLEDEQYRLWKLFDYIWLGDDPFATPENYPVSGFEFN